MMRLHEEVMTQDKRTSVLAVMQRTAGKSMLFCLAHG